MLWYWLWLWLLPSPGIHCLSFRFGRCLSVCLLFWQQNPFSHCPIEQKARNEPSHREITYRHIEDNKVEPLAFGASMPLRAHFTTSRYFKVCCKKKTASGTSFESFYPLFITTTNESWSPFFSLFLFMLCLLLAVQWVCVPHKYGICAA